jgi:uncharacterized membrane protein
VTRPERPAEKVTGEVLINRPVEDVYRFYRDFTNLPRFLGDVVAVEQLSDTTYRWLVSGPFGARLPMTITVTEERLNRLLRYQSRGPAPLRGRWELEFLAEADGRRTRVQERLVTPLGPLGRSVLALIGKFPDQEVADNLGRLKQVLEATTGDDPPSVARPGSSAQPDAPDDGERDAT